MPLEENPPPPDEGCFETIKVAAGQALFLDKHLERLDRHLRYLPHYRPSDLRGVTAAIKNLLKSKGEPGGWVKLSVYPRREGAQVIYESGPPRELEKKRSLKLYPFFVSRELLLRNSKAKWCQRSFYQQGLERALAQGADEAAFVDENHKLITASRGNLCVLGSRELYVPRAEEGALLGLMRERVLNCCREKELPIRKEAFNIHELGDAQAVFMTNSLIGLKKVTEIEGFFKSDEKHGLQAAFVDYLAGICLDDLKGGH